MLISRGRSCRVREPQLETGKKVLNCKKIGWSYYPTLSLPSSRKSGSQIYSSVFAQLFLKPQNLLLRRETHPCQLEAAILGQVEIARNPHRDGFLWWMDVYFWTLLMDRQEKFLTFHITFVFISL